MRRKAYLVQVMCGGKWETQSTWTSEAAAIDARRAHLAMGERARIVTETPTGVPA